VPIDLGGSTGASGIHVIAYNNLLRHLGLPTGTVQSNDVMQQLAVVDEAVGERFHADMLRIDAVTFVRARFSYPLFDGLDVEFPTELDLSRFDDGGWVPRHASGKRYLKPPGGLYFDAEDTRGWYGFGMPMTDEALGERSRNARELHQSTDYALTAGFRSAACCRDNSADRTDASGQVLQYLNRSMYDLYTGEFKAARGLSRLARQKRDRDKWEIQE